MYRSRRQWPHKFIGKLCVVVTCTQRSKHQQGVYWLRSCCHLYLLTFKSEAGDISTADLLSHVPNVPISSRIYIYCETAEESSEVLFHLLSRKETTVFSRALEQSCIFVRCKWTIIYFNWLITLRSKLNLFFLNIQRVSKCHIMNTVKLYRILTFNELLFKFAYISLVLNEQSFLTLPAYTEQSSKSFQPKT